jgi:hypothetical protein
MGYTVSTSEYAAYGLLGCNTVYLHVLTNISEELNTSNYKKTDDFAENIRICMTIN